VASAAAGKAGAAPGLRAGGRSAARRVKITGISLSGKTKKKTKAEKAEE